MTTVHAASLQVAYSSDSGKQTCMTDVDASTLFDAMFSHAAVGMAVIDVEGHVLRVNDAFCQFVGYGREELLGIDFQRLAHPDELALNLDLARRLLSGESNNFHLENRYLRRDGRAVWGILTGTLARTTDGRACYFIFQVQDVTARKQAEEAERALRHTQRLLEHIIVNIEDGVVLLDEARTALICNRAYSAMFALDESTLRGLTQEQFLAHAASLAEDPMAFEQDFADLTYTPGSHVAHFTLLKPKRRVLRRSTRPIESEGHRYYLVVWHDVTQDYDRALHQDHMAHTDALTDLPNRRAADEALPREISRARRAKGKLCAVMMDIDHFKRVNDNFGHAVGDAVLRTIAAAIQGQSRSADLVARWGGEEFVAFVSTDRAGARLFADRVRLAVEDLHLPDVGPITISAGVGEYRGELDGAAMMAEADANLYRAKSSGRNCVCD